MAKFIASTDGGAKRMNYIINNLDVDSFRDEFVCVLIRSREYDKAIDLLKEAIIDKYSKNIGSYPQKTGRDHHRDIVRAIRRVNKLGDRAAVDFLVSEMRVKFKNRRTLILIEELDKI